MAGNEQRKATLGECGELIRDTISPAEIRQVPYIGLEHIEEGTLHLTTHGWSDEVDSSKSRFKQGDILFGKLRPYFRKVIQAPFDGVCSTDIWVVRAKEGIDQRFLYYWMASQDFVDAVSQASEGTKMPRAVWDYAARFSRAVPPLPEQRRIAHILGTLDDKIELNRRMNATLEAIAQAIFKSWFVDFDPVRAKAYGRPSCLPADLDALFPDNFKDSESGEIPKGWEVLSFGDVVEIHDSKRIPLSNRDRTKRPGQYPYYGATSIMDYIDDYIFEGIYVLVGEDGSVVDDFGYPVTQYVWGKFWANNHAHVIQGKNGVSTEFVLLWLRQISIAPYITGAVQPKLNQANMKSIRFIKPPESLIRSFDRNISSLFSMIRCNTDQSLLLQEIRDKLLPHLMRGEPN